MKLDELAARAEQNSLALLELERTARTEEASEAETDSESDEVLGRLYELHQEQENIRREAEVLENPKLRAALSSKAASARKRVQESLTREAGILLVWRSGDLAGLAGVVTSVAAEFGEGAKVLVYCELQQALDSSVAGDVIVICSAGEHQVSSLGSLAGGGSILARGLQEKKEDGCVVITPGDTASVILSITSGSLHLENVTLESGNVRVGVLVSGAELTMKNVNIRGPQTAVLADRDSQVKLTDSIISASDTAVEVSSGAECEMSDCVIENSKTGVCAREGAVLTARGVVVRNNRSYGIIIQSRLQPDQEGIWSGDEAVEKAAQHGVKLVDVEFRKNVIGDVGVLEMKEMMTESPLLERRNKNTRRFSTPMSGKAQKLDMETSADNQSPIPRSLARVLSYPM